MTLAGEAVKGLRLAGQNLLGYFSDPKNLYDIGKNVAKDTALGTAVSQSLRMVGMPAPNPVQTALNIGASSAIMHPISGALRSVGVPAWAANTTGQILGSAGSQLLNPAIQSAVRPQQQKQQQLDPRILQALQLQQLNEELEERQNRRQINLALARNYTQPTRIIHTNPSAEMATVHEMLNPRVSY